MLFYIFECSKNKNLFAVTDVASGEKLPLDACAGGKWKFAAQVHSSRCALFSAEEAAQSIKEKGYYLHHGSAKVKITENLSPLT